METPDRHAQSQRDDHRPYPPHHHYSLEHMYQVKQELGELRGRSKAIEDRMEGLERRIDKRLEDQAQTLDRANAKLDQVISTLDKSSGGWKALTVVGTVIVTLAAGLAWMIDTVSGKLV